MFKLFKRKIKNKSEAIPEYKIVEDLINYIKRYNIKNYTLNIETKNEHKYLVYKEEIINIKTGNESWETSNSNSSTFYI